MKTKTQLPNHQNQTEKSMAASVLETNPKASHMLGKLSTTEPSMYASLPFSRSNLFWRHRRRKSGLLYKSIETDLSKTKKSNVLIEYVLLQVQMPGEQSAQCQRAGKADSPAHPSRSPDCVREGVCGWKRQKLFVFVGLGEMSLQHSSEDMVEPECGSNSSPHVIYHKWSVAGGRGGISELWLLGFLKVGFCF